MVQPVPGLRPELASLDWNPPMLDLETLSGNSTLTTPGYI